MPGQKHQAKPTGKGYFMLSGSIIADAAGDALCATGHKLPGHSLQALSIGFLLPLVYMLDLEKGTWDGTSQLIAYSGSPLFRSCLQSNQGPAIKLYRKLLALG